MTSMRRNDVASTSFRRHMPSYDVVYRIERNSFAGTGGWIIGGAKGYVGPPLKLLGGGLAPPGPPSSYAYDLHPIFAC